MDSYDDDGNDFLRVLLVCALGVLLYVLVQP